MLTPNHSCFTMCSKAVNIATMNNRLSPIPLTIQRVPVGVLSDIVYGVAPMPLETAETIRALRLHHRFSYQDIMWALSESDPSGSQCYGFGKALVELACLRLKDFDPNWK